MLQNVQRQRRQRTIIGFAIVILLVAIIVGVVIFYPRAPPDPVRLPSYLDHCVLGSLVYHSHPNLVITISGVSQQIPVTFGSGFDTDCARVIHTHDSTGVLHVETDQDMNYTLGDWFLIWGHWAGSTTTTIFNSTQVFNNKVGSGHTLTMTVNGNPDMNPGDFKGGNPSAFQDLMFPRNAGTSSTCAASSGCQPWNIVITYT
ncbi:hypothetical protein J2P12_01575 [Candidatus Bathyarchaeota archaeon]|nr:hypothetical protein [Candidatus Bathyarchaeota archaeon]